MLYDYHILALVFLISTGFLGSVLNTMFIYFTIRKSELRKGYAWFLCAIMGANFLYCFNNFIPQTIVIVTNVPPSNAICKVVGLIITTNGIAAVCFEPLLAVNRYFSLYHSHLVAKYFSNRKNAVMISVVYVFSITMAMVLYSLGDMNRLGDTICGPQVEKMKLTHIALFAAPMFLSYGICVFCGYKIYSLLKKHQKATKQKEMRSQMQDAKEIIRLIVLEITVPVAIETPVLMLSILGSFDIEIPLIVVSISLCLFILHHVFDPIIVVFVMKPYRNYLKHTFNKWRGKTIMVQEMTMSNATVSSQVSRRTMMTTGHN